MSRIQQLDPHVINRIAAGEVIERPASVLKELLENSIDALSTRIEVDIVSGGLELIRISDNGEGMHPDDMQLAVTSHATSKIRSDRDLEKVSTLGFRGEALASIASISRFRIRTRRPENPTGQELHCDGGEITLLQECGCPAGTTIEVHNLFFNTPARRKFLKKPSTEFGRISEQFSRIALPNPNLHMVLKHNGKQVYELPATTNQEERIRRFFGADIGDKLIAVESETETADGKKIRLWGYVGEPSLNKSTRKDQYLFLNGRCIVDRSLQHALGEAYRGLMMVGRHPVSFLFLEVPPSLVDVNVHPTKTEVRFQDGQSLYRQLLHTLRDKFRELEFQSELAIPVAPRAAKSASLPQSEPTQRELELWAKPTPAVRPALSAISTTFRAGGSSTAPAPKSVAFRADVIDALSAPATSAPAALAPTTSAHTTLPADFASDPEIPIDNMDSTPQPVAPSETLAAPVTTGDFRAFQVHDCYLVVATDDGIEVIDQHALHERILYEYLRLRVLDGNVERQKLLIPEAIECTAGEAATLMEYRDLLAEIGFEVEDFGGTTVLLHSHPVMMPKRSLQRAVKDLAGQLEETDGKTSRRDLLDNMMHTMACRAAIKAGQRLTPEEMIELLEQRYAVQDSHHCPHGRPTAMKLSKHTLDKQFGRLG